MNLPKGFEYLNTAFYSNVPGGDYIYFVLEFDQIKALIMANGIFVKFEKHTFCGYFGEHGPFQQVFDVFDYSKARSDSKEDALKDDLAAVEADTAQLQQILDKDDHAAEEAAAKPLSNETDDPFDFEGNQDVDTDEDEPINVDEKKKNWLF